MSHPMKAGTVTRIEISRPIQKKQQTMRRRGVHGGRQGNSSNVKKASTESDCLKDVTGSMYLNSGSTGASATMSTKR